MLYTEMETMTIEWINEEINPANMILFRCSPSINVFGVVSHSDEDLSHIQTIPTYWKRLILEAHNKQ